MYTQQDYETITQLILSRTPDPRAIYLFGSCARGTEREDSDMDIAVLVERAMDRKNKLHLLQELWNITGDNGYSVDFIIKTFRDFMDEINLPTLSNIIHREGRVLWQKN
jgi:predicted nucleotidyltransferase